MIEWDVSLNCLKESLYSSTKLSIKNEFEKFGCGNRYLFIYFFLVYKLDLAVGFFEIFGKNFSLLYHWILFIACLHDNIRVSMRQECRIIKFFLIIDYPDNR